MGRMSLAHLRPLTNLSSGSLMLLSETFTKYLKESQLCYFDEHLSFIFF